MKFKEILFWSALTLSTLECKDLWTIHGDYYQTGEVLKKKYIQPKLENKLNQHLFSTTETVIVGDSKLLLTAKSNKGTYYINVEDGYAPKEFLNENINIGDKIKFKTGTFKANKRGDTLYYSDFNKGYGTCYVGWEISKK